MILFILSNKSLLSEKCSEIGFNTSANPLATAILASKGCTFPSLIAEISESVLSQDEGWPNSGLGSIFNLPILGIIMCLIIS